MRIMSQSGKLKPNLDQQSTKLLNLTVLQRFDSSIQNILFIAAHVSLYDFNVDASKWSRKGVEGSLFVVKRNDQPQFQFIVMNRRNTDNLVENLVADFEFELNVPYLLYRNAAKAVIGVWFYNSTECEEVADLIHRILHSFSSVPPETNVHQGKRELQALEAEPIVTAEEGPPEPSLVAPAVTTAKVPSLVKIFCEVLRTGIDDSISEHSRQPYHSSGVIAPSHVPGVVLSSAPYPPVPAVSPSPIAFLDSSDTSSSKTRIDHLLKSSSFLPAAAPSSLLIPPIPPSLPTATTATYPSWNLQRPYEIPILQSPPCPTPPSSPFTILSRDKVADALSLLIQDDRFIDMFYHALEKKHRYEL